MNSLGFAVVGIIFDLAFFMSVFDNMSFANEPEDIKKQHTCLGIKSQTP